MCAKPASALGNPRTLYVVDKNNNRVLTFSFTADPSGTTASNVIGQSNFTTGTTADSAVKLNNPTSIALDLSGNRLFVVCQGQNAVLIHDVSSVSDRQAASKILGQTAFTDATSGSTADKFNLPFAATYDPTDQRLFLADSNNRVLVFEDMEPTAITDGRSASYVLGQANFTTNTDAVSTTQMWRPADVAYDSVEERVFVADMNNSRVLVFDVDPSTISNGAAAMNVIGQSSFTTRTLGGNTQSGMTFPKSLTFDSTGQRLFVADPGSHRVTVYDTSALATTGQPAAAVIGQTNFTAAGSGTTRAKFLNPYSVRFDALAQRIHVADVSNNRIMMFATGASVSYAPTTFMESAGNNGAIGTTSIITLLNNTFSISSGVLTPTTDYTVLNLPAGLTATITVTSPTTATLSFNGNTSSHEAFNNVSNLTVVFQDNAFGHRTAANTTASTKNDLAIVFTNAPTPTNTPTVTPTPPTTSTAAPTASSIPTAVPTPTATIASSEIAGRLVDQNGQGVPNAVVYLSLLSESQDARAVGIPDESAIASTTTSSGGWYSFKGLKRGTYKVERLTPPRSYATSGQTTRYIVKHGVTRSFTESWNTKRSRKES